ncbi:MAG: hypothetical protein E5W39_05745 [Mesorhizobium sp.]|nr:MAG: hypothetical protein E5W39_05745 [Mesorhizobium sp.]
MLVSEPNTGFDPLWPSATTIADGSIEPSAVVLSRQSEPWPPVVPASRHSYSLDVEHMIIVKTDPDHPDAQILLDVLSEALTRITGDSGQYSFDANNFKGRRSVFGPCPCNV